MNTRLECDSQFVSIRNMYNVDLFRMYIHTYKCNLLTRVFLLRERDATLSLNASPRKCLV